MREKCADCVRKHFGSGVSVINEILQGYDDFGLYVAGELNQAEQECLKLDTGLAAAIRDFRLETLDVLDRLVSGQLSIKEAADALPEHSEIRETIKMHCLRESTLEYCEKLDKLLCGRDEAHAVPAEAAEEPAAPDAAGTPRKLDSYERAMMFDLMHAAQLNAQYGDGGKALYVMGSISGDPVGHLTEIKELLRYAEASADAWRRQEAAWYRRVLQGAHSRGRRGGNE